MFKRYIFFRIILQIVGDFVAIHTILESNKEIKQRIFPPLGNIYSGGFIVKPEEERSEHTKKARVRFLPILFWRKFHSKKAWRCKRES